MSEPVVVVVGVDFSELAERALHLAHRFALGCDAAELHAVTVMEPDHVQLPPDLTQDARDAALSATARTLEEYLARELAGSRIGIVSGVRVGAPADEILSLARERSATLIAVGTHGRRGFERLFTGSVAESVLKDAPCAVLVARA